MTFDSLTFAVFITILFGLVALTRGWQARKGQLLAASYLFYAAWNPVFIFLLVISTVVDWYAARFMHASVTQGKRRMWLVVSLVVNLGLLAWFKYAGFLTDNFNALLATVAPGLAWQPPALDIILPIGISFYTFQTLSYTIDVYRRRIEPGRSFSDYALYVSFFPQLVAGPIVRYEQFIGQLIKPRTITGRDVEIGIALMLGGLFLKTVLADSLFAPVVDAGFAAAIPVADASWAAIFSFSGQIYCDFAGYSLCAIGAARVFGFALPKNFHAPYAAVGFSDFWRRWHISLSTWIRDYLYISLGGNRHGKWLTIRNLIITMGLGGLWHGAAWTFILWGLLHGLYLVIEHVLRSALSGWRFLASRPMQVLWALLTLLAVTLAWVLFRAESLEQAITFYGALAGLNGSGEGLNTMACLALAAMVGLVAWHAWIRRREITELYERLAWPLRGLLIALLLATILASPGEHRAFIYFQF